MWYVLVILGGYLLGCSNMALYLSKIKKVRMDDKGSGNLGASNALMLMGVKAGVLVGAHDIGKAWIAVLLARWLCPELAFAGELAGAACILGHIFPFYMKFRGGKGLACLGGAILAYHPLVFAVMLTLEIVIVLVTKYICFVPMTASVLFTILYGVLERDPVGGAILISVCVVIFCKHMVNLRRIRAGSELRISYLWNRDGEIERLRDVYPDGKPR
jgi:glycerol-3-phosphate acyltransferase PlsY